MQACGLAGVPLAREAKVERQLVCGLQHHLDLLRSRGACSGFGAGRRPRAPSKQRCDAAGNRLSRQLGAYKMHVNVQRAGSKNEPLACNNLCVDLEKWGGVWEVCKVGLNAAYHVHRRKVGQTVVYLNLTINQITFNLNTNVNNPRSRSRETEAYFEINIELPA